MRAPRSCQRTAGLRGIAAPRGHRPRVEVDLRPVAAVRLKRRVTAEDWVRPVVSRRRVAVAAGTGRSFMPGRMAAVPRKLPHAVLSMPADDVSTQPAAMSALCGRLMVVPTHFGRSGYRIRCLEADARDTLSIARCVRPGLGTGGRVLAATGNNSHAEVDHPLAV